MKRGTIERKWMENKVRHLGKRVKIKVLCAEKK